MCTQSSQVSQIYSRLAKSVSTLALRQEKIGRAFGLQRQRRCFTIINIGFLTLLGNTSTLVMYSHLEVSVITVKFEAGEKYSIFPKLLDKIFVLLAFISKFCR